MLYAKGFLLEYVVEYEGNVHRGRQNKFLQKIFLQEKTSYKILSLKNCLWRDFSWLTFKTHTQRSWKCQTPYLVFFIQTTFNEIQWKEQLSFLFHKVLSMPKCLQYLQEILFWAKLRKFKSDIPILIFFTILTPIPKFKNNLLDSIRQKQDKNLKLLLLKISLIGFSWAFYFTKQGKLVFVYLQIKISR